jgi:hypothetical protein
MRSEVETLRAALQEAEEAKGKLEEEKTRLDQELAQARILKSINYSEFVS